LFAVEGSNSSDCKSDHAGSQVLQLGEKVLQPLGVKAIEDRLSAIESQIKELKSLIFQGRSEADADRENQRPRARFEPVSCPPQDRDRLLLHPARHKRQWQVVDSCAKEIGRCLLSRTKSVRKRNYFILTSSLFG
jgi:hypothetical protein